MEPAVTVTDIKKEYLQVPQARRLGKWGMLGRALAGALLSPIYYLLAKNLEVPGLEFRKYCATLGLRLLARKSSSISYNVIYNMIFWPMDSTRYFEFDFVASRLKGEGIGNYLDISSPRLLPISLVDSRAATKAVFINPNKSDLEETITLLRACGLGEKVQCKNQFIEDYPDQQDHFDVITCISVLEHIPSDDLAIKKMWRLLKPGGKLFLTVPCARATYEQYINVNQYGLDVPVEGKFNFLQRFYDNMRVENTIYATTGRPVFTALYGERRAGLFKQYNQESWTNPNYPRWRDPYRMGKEFGYFSSIDELPGEGVLAMEFVKV